MAINQLLRFKPPNLGVVGPSYSHGNSRILAFDMVHRTHVQIFLNHT